MQRLILIRHGEAEHLVSNLTGGWTDTRLTRLGERQARRTGKALAALLQGKELQFYSSDLRRASQTAALIAPALGKAPVITTSLREISNGDAANRSRSEAQAMFLPMTQPRLDWQPYPGAETWRAFLSRLLPFMENLPAEPSTVVLVAHANVLVAAVQWWLEMDDVHIDQTHFFFHPCSITDLQISNWGLKLVYKSNDTSHLAGLNENPERRS